MAPNRRHLVPTEAYSSGRHPRFGLSQISRLRSVAHHPTEDTHRSELRCRIEPFLDQGGACGAAGAPRHRAMRWGARPARVRRDEQRPAEIQLIDTGGPVGHLPRLPLSSSQAPRLGRPPGVASRWLRQPRPGTHSQGFRAGEEDGGRAGSDLCEHPARRYTARRGAAGRREA